MGNAKPVGKGGNAVAVGDTYRALHQRSLTDPEGFWAEAAEDDRLEQAWDKVLDDSNTPFYRWFVGGELNTCYNAVDRHVERGRGEQVALIYDSPVTGTIQTFTYRELRDQVAQVRGRCCAARRRQGRSSHRLHADDPAGRDRHARVRTARRGSLGGLRRLCAPRTRRADRRRQAEARRSRPRAASRPGRVVQYKPLLDAAIDAGQPQARALPASSSGRRRARGTGAGPRPRLGRGWRGAQPHGCVPVEGDRPALHPVHLGHRPASPRASCATTAAMPWR